MSKIPYRPFPHRPANHPVPQDVGEPVDRRPTFNQQGGFRAFRSVPGATQSDRNVSTGIRPDGSSGFSKEADWADFFKGNSPTGVRYGYQANNQAIADAANMDQPVGQMTGNNIPGLPPGSAEDIRRNAQPIGGAGYPTPTVNPPDPEMGDNIPGLDASSSTPSATGYLSNVIDSTQNWMKQNFGDMYG